MWKCLWLFIVVTIVHSDEKSFVNFGGFVCPREDKALGKCLRDALNTYIPQLATGVPEFGVPPCEPMLIPSLSFQQSAGPISITSTFSDVTVRGPSQMKVKHVEVHSKNHSVIATLHIPELRTKGDYSLKGQLLMLPIDGSGKFSAKYGDIDAIVTIVLGRIPKANAADALACKSLDVKFNVGKVSIDLDSLFGGDDDLGKTLNKFLNENWEKLLTEFQTPMEDALRDFLKPLADHTFGMLSADDILLSK